MNRRRNTIGLLATGFLLLSQLSVAARTTSLDANRAWQDYLTRDMNLQPSYTFPHATCFRSAALAHNIPETLLLAVARGESDFEATARSHANAYGVMQILWPGTANHLGIYKLSDLFDPCTNIDAGTRYLKELLSRYDGNIHLALAAYNYGPNRIATNGQKVPSGAKWYSAYIYRHLNYVLGDKSHTRTPGRHLYTELGRSTLVSFGEPYRAAAFVTRLEKNAPNLQLDWFRKGVGDFVVVFSYADKAEFDKGAQLLSRAGFPL